MTGSPEPGWRREAGAVPAVHCVATDAVAARPGFVERARALLERLGPDGALHLRLREATGRELHELAAPLAEVAAEVGGWCVVNGRADVALTAGAQAAQLGAGAVPIEALAPAVGGRLRLGASVHGPEEAVRAARGGAYHVLLGTTYPTPSHPGRPGVGPEGIVACRRALDRADLARVPLVAIGGIDARRAREVRRAGAAGLAAVRAVWDATDPAAAAGRLRAAFRDGSTKGARG